MVYHHHNLGHLSEKYLSLYETAAQFTSRFGKLSNMNHHKCSLNAAECFLEAFVLRDMQNISILNYFLILHQSIILVRENQF